MVKRTTMLFVAVLVLGCMAWAAPKSWVGTVSDSNCGLKHSAPSAAAEACVKKCVEGGAKYVLVSHGKIYSVEPQDKFADFAGKSVKVTGTMEGTAITATEVSAASMGKHMKKSSM